MDDLTGRGTAPDAAELALRAWDEDADDRLRLVFTCAHPALTLDARVALTLRTVAGLDTASIAHAFFVSEATMAQRLVRAKRRIAHAGIPFRIPDLDELPARLDGALAVLYLVFNEGYAASTGEELLRVDLAAEAIRLLRLVIELVPDESCDEARALLALMLLQHSRRDARVDARGDLVSLEEQDRGTWDAEAIAEATALLRAPHRVRGGYRVQAELAAEHARAPRAADTEWARIVALYDELGGFTSSPSAALGRAVAVGMARGPREGLRELDALDESGSLEGSHLLAAARADLLRRCGESDTAARAYREALALAPTAAEQRQLERRLHELEGGAPRP